MHSDRYDGIRDGGISIRYDFFESPGARSVFQQPFAYGSEIDIAFIVRKNADDITVVSEMLFQDKSRPFRPGPYRRLGSYPQFSRRTSIQGINAGRGSFQQVTRMINTKFWRGQIRRIVGKTFGKMLAYNLFYSSLGSIANGVIDAWQYYYNSLGDLLG